MYLTSKLFLPLEPNFIQQLFQGTVVPVSTVRSHCVMMSDGD